MSLSVISEVLGLFVDTLTADDKYYLRNTGNLPQPVQMQLSKKQKTFSEFFAPTLKSTSNFEQLQKSLHISEIADCE